VSRSIPLLASLVLLAACGRGAPAAGGGPDDPNALRGSVLPEARPKSDFTLTDTDGRPFDFRARTDGRVTLLYFGYTHCPDVCPVTLGNLAAALQQVPLEVRDAVRVVFVTTDPARDTPQVMRDWLDHFDRSFVGLTGDRQRVNAIMRGYDLPPAAPETPAHRTPSDSSYTVGHAATVLAFTPDDSLRVLYGATTRQADWAHDLPRLVAGEVPAGS